MNRRVFTLAGLASLAATVAPASFAEEGDQTGWQIADLTNDGLRLTHGGMPAPGTPVDDRTLFQVASCSKTVAALAVFTLVRDGHVELKKPVNGYLKRWRLTGPRSDRTTISELLSHTAGTNIHGFMGYGVNDDIPGLIDILNGQYPATSPAIRTERRLFKRYNYSGGGTTVLQCLIEDVVDVSFSDYASSQILNPIGATDATFELEPRRSHANGFLEDGQPIPGGFVRHPESAAAGLWASATDLIRIMRSIIVSLNGDSAALLPSDLAKQMITPVTTGVAHGVFVEPGKTIGHDGRNEGFESAMIADLVSGRVRAGVTNRNGQMQHVLDADHALHGRD
ncbi:serine hydrolase domain-containing protein [Roseobacter sp.]|uniref:serine hydrolase domain-containing protein n=1 Tax=Roseobacter sp. TaxID=1907202 RepID=UPI00385B0CD1